MRELPSGFAALSILLRSGLPAPVTQFPAIVETRTRSYDSSTELVWHGNPKCGNWGNEPVKAAIASISELADLNRGYTSDQGCECQLTGDDTLAAWVEDRLTLAHLLQLQAIVNFWNSPDEEPDGGAYGLVAAALAELADNPPPLAVDPSVGAHVYLVLDQVRAAMPAWRARLDLPGDERTNRVALLNDRLARAVLTRRGNHHYLTAQTSADIAALVEATAGAPDQLVLLNAPSIELPLDIEGVNGNDHLLFEALGAGQIIGALHGEFPSQSRWAVRVSKLAAEWLQETLRGRSCQVLGEAAADPAEDTMQTVEIALRLAADYDLDGEDSVRAARGILAPVG
jgi:hypothetical protein